MASQLSGYYDGVFEEKIKNIDILDYSENFHKKIPGSHIQRSVSILESTLSGLKQGETPGVLEIGVGTGAMMHWFRLKGLNPVGVDISQQAVNTLKEKGFDMRLADLNENPLPFSENSFDIVLSLDVIEHVIDPIFFMSELFRVCAPGGHVVISTANSRTLKSMYILMVRGRFPWTSHEKLGWDCGHLHYFTSRDVVELGKNMGFNIVKQDGASLIPGGVKGVLKKSLFAALPSSFTREFLCGNIVFKFQKPTA